MDKIQIQEYSTKQGVIDIVQFNSATEIYSKPSLVAMVTKYENFNTKFTITRLILRLNNLMFSQTFDTVFVMDSSTSKNEIINKTANIIHKNCNHFI